MTALAPQSSVAAVPTTARKLSVFRRKMGSRSVLTFARLYLAEEFKLEPSAMHEEIADLLRSMTTKRGCRLAVAAPRGHAKSTLISLAYVLWCLCYGHERYIVLFSHSKPQAEDHLAHVKKALTDNALLNQDFPGVAEPLGSRPGPERWTRAQIITASSARVQAVGGGSGFRGTRHGAQRPGLIILDDAEDAEHVRNPDQRRKIREWFNRTVSKAGTGTTNIIIAGTILHLDSLLAEHLDPTRSPGWDGRTYRAVIKWAANRRLWEHWERIYRRLEPSPRDAAEERDRAFREFQRSGKPMRKFEQLGPEAAREFFLANQEALLEGAEVLWPQRENYLELMELRLREGPASFDCEKQNTPVDPETCLFRESQFIYWDDQFENVDDLIRAKGRSFRYFGAVDLAMGKTGGDDTAIVTVAKESGTDTLYVLDADIRNRNPEKTVETIIYYCRLRPYTRFMVEENGFQGLVQIQLEARARTQLSSGGPFKGVTNTTHKAARIEGLQGLVASGQLRFSKRHHQLMEQLRQFPHGAHDDGPDALEMAVREALEYRGGVYWVNT